MSTAVATIAPPRLPYHPAIEERYGVDRSQWKALVEAVFPLAKTPDAVVLALSYCKARRLDPFKRVVHIVPIWDNESRRYVETVWPGIAEHRTTAFRTGQYAGADPCSYGPEQEFTFSGELKDKTKKTVKLTVPAWAQLTLYRMIQGQRVPLPGPRVYFIETYSRMGRTELPNDRWQRAPMQMLEKCAEAAALRRAFPEEIGDEAVAEEGQLIQASRADGDAPPRPTRAEFVETPAATAEPEAEAVDAETGEVIEEVVGEPEPAEQPTKGPEQPKQQPVKPAVALAEKMRPVVGALDACQSDADVEAAERDVIDPLIEEWPLQDKQYARGLVLEKRQQFSGRAKR